MLTDTTHITTNLYMLQKEGSHLILKCVNRYISTFQDYPLLSNIYTHSYQSIQKMRPKPHSHSNNGNISQRFISHIIGPSLSILFSLVLKGILRDSHPDSRHVIFFNLWLRTTFLKHIAVIVFQAVILI